MRVLIVHDGRFGAAVAARLAAIVPGADQETLDEACRDDGPVTQVDVVLVALWRRRHRALDHLDSLCHRAGVRWSQAVLDGTSLLVGPLVVPGHGPCYSCFWRRFLTHVRVPQWEMALASAYDDDPTRGPAGFCPAAVGMAAAGLVADARADARHAGRVVRTSLLGTELLETRVVKVHGCSRCGAPEAAAPGQRFVNLLVPQLTEMLEP